MNIENNRSDGIEIVKYSLELSEVEAREGVTRILPRKGKRLQVTIPAGVITGNTVKLTNALKVTDDKPGDIIIHITVKDNNSVKQANAPAGVLEINDANFNDEVLSSDLPVVVDFWAPWCGPCRMMSPVVEQASELYRGRFKFCKINVDENPGSAANYQAMSIPMLLFFKNGQLVDKSVGAIPLAQLQSRLDTLSG